MIDQIEVCKRDQHWRNPVRRGVESQLVILTAGSVPSSRLFRVNSTLFGLGSGVWTRDVSKTHRLAKAIRAGSVWVNCYQAMDPAVPFGGYKSGYSRESVPQQLEKYLNVKGVWIKTA